MKHAPLRGLRCFPRESTGSMSGKCGWAFGIVNLPDGLANLLGRWDVTRPVCADTALAASMRSDPPPERGSLEGSRGEVPVAGVVKEQVGSRLTCRNQCGADQGHDSLDRLSGSHYLVGFLSSRWLVERP